MHESGQVQVRKREGGPHFSTVSQDGGNKQVNLYRKTMQLNIATLAEHGLKAL